MQQAKEYAEMLGLKFAFATNGHEIIEFDYLAGQEKVLEEFPTPLELWGRYTQAAGLQPEAEKTLREPPLRISPSSHFRL
jgi:type I restriction enzyme R subunit